MINWKKVVKYVFIVLIILLVLASVAFNVLIFWKQYRMNIYNAGAQAAAQAVYAQAQKGDVTITIGQDTVTLIKKPNANQ